MILAVLGVALLLTAALTFVFVRHFNQQSQSQGLRATGIPSSLSTPLANLMGLSPVPSRRAPNFTLTDQNGHTLSLASLRGRTVVLEFMDPHCTDICPFIAQEYVNAYHDLGKAASGAVFIAVNVNQYYASVANMARFSREHGLNTIPSWHFFTGSTNDLTKVWHGFGIEVSAPNPNADIIHTSIMYFIDPSGRERYIAVPTVGHTSMGAAFLRPTSIASWGQGIATVTRSLAG